MTSHGTNFKAYVDKCIDRQWLSEHVGHAVRPHYLRLKPGTSIAVGYVRNTPDADGAAHGVAEFGWARLLWPDARSKAAKAADKARERGESLRSAWLDGEILFQTGTMLTDPKLIEVLEEAGLSVRSAGELGGVEVLRYNPLRRVVVRNGEQVVRISAAQQLDEDSYRAVGRAVEVVPMIDFQPGGYISTMAYVGAGDLAHGDAAAQDPLHEEAGRMLARLHASARLAVDTACTDGRAQLEAHAGVLDSLDANLAARVRCVAQTLPAVGGEQVVLHGDASPDQFLHSPTGEVWMTDFDRLCTGPAAMDLGSYLAECGEAAGRALLTGYGELRELPSPHRLVAAKAHSLAARLMGPLRAAQPDWRERVSQGLEQLEQTITESLRLTPELAQEGE